MHWKRDSCRQTDGRGREWEREKRDGEGGGELRLCNVMKLPLSWVFSCGVHIDPDNHQGRRTQPQSTSTKPVMCSCRGTMSHRLPPPSPVSVLIQQHIEGSLARQCVTEYLIWRPVTVLVKVSLGGSVSARTNRHHAFSSTSTWMDPLRRNDDATVTVHSRPRQQTFFFFFSSTIFGRWLVKCTRTSGDSVWRTKTAKRWKRRRMVEIHSGFFRLSTPSILPSRVLI